jgi:hypothetical protein
MGIADAAKSLGKGVVDLAGAVADGVASGIEAAATIVDDVTPDDVSPLEDAGGAVPDDVPGALLDVDPETIAAVVDILASGVA